MAIRGIKPMGRDISDITQYRPGWGDQLPDFEVNTEIAN